uniref:Transthyretin-like family protein n=1 Tax=Panagrolaimus davidi TaxID=227884 RepID=A0A914Q483_9BILA
MRFIFFFIAAAIIASTVAYDQTVKVNGTISCNRRVARNVLVQLRERDTFDTDDTLASMYTNDDGTFRLTGTEDEITSIRPYLRITHTCGVTARDVCHKITEIEIEKKFVNGETFNLDIYLENQKSKETCD